MTSAMRGSVSMPTPTHPARCVGECALGKPLPGMVLKRSLPSGVWPGGSMGALVLAAVLHFLGRPYGCGCVCVCVEKSPGLDPTHGFLQQPAQSPGGTCAERALAAHVEEQA